MVAERYKHNAGAVFSLKSKALAHVAAQFKGFTSRVLRQEFKHLKSSMPCLWSRSYYVGSVGHVSDATVRRYIEMQKAGPRSGREPGGAR